jgi:YggT family protein
MLLNLLNILASTVDLFFRILSFLIIIRIFLSWLAPGTGGQIAYFVHSTTEPIMRIFRQPIFRFGMIDLSPIVALLAVDFAREIIIRLIFGLA